jgi:hypothetical protein
MPNLAFRNRMAQPLVDEMDRFAAQTNAAFAAEHAPDGTHLDVSALSLAADTLALGKIVPLGTLPAGVFPAITDARGQTFFSFSASTANAVYTAILTGTAPPENGRLVGICNIGSNPAIFSGSAPLSNQIVTPLWLGPGMSALWMYQSAFGGVGGWVCVGTTGATWALRASTLVAQGGTPGFGTGGGGITRYSVSGMTCQENINFTLGTGFSFGTGLVGAGTLFAAQASSVGILGAAVALDVSASARYPITTVITTLSSLPAAALFTWSSPLAALSTTSPITFAAGDIFQLRVVYEINTLA